jgi:hypothetical protein
MVELKIEKNGPELFSFQLHFPDGSIKVMRFKKDGTSTRRLADAGLYLLDWAVRGKEGSKFSYKVEIDDRVLEELKEAEVSGAQWEGGYLSFTVAS